MDIFQNWFFRVENKLGCITKIFHANSGKEFIFIKLEIFHKKKILSSNMQYLICPKKYVCKKKIKNDYHHKKFTISKKTCL